MDKDFNYDDFERFMNYIESRFDDKCKNFSLSFDPNIHGADLPLEDYIEYELKKMDDLEAEVSSQPSYDTVDNLLKAVKEQ